MPEPLPILIPLLNPNEPEAMLVAVHVQEGQKVAQGDPLCTLETTKSAADLSAEAAGYVLSLRFSQGQTARAGDIFAYLAGAPDDPIPAAPTQGPASDLSAVQATQVGLRISQPALSLARQAGLDLDRLPRDVFVTESLVQAMLSEQRDVPAPAVSTTAFDPQAIIVYGAGGHGKSLIELLRALGTYRIAGIIDDGVKGAGEGKPAEIMGIPVLGGAEVLPELHAQGIRLAVNAVGGIGNIAVRVKIFERLAHAGFVCPAVVHPTAFMEPSASISPGVQVFPHAYVGSGARLGFGVIVNSGAIVSHDCLLDDYANIAPGALLAGEVQVGARALVGMGVTINLQARIGAGARIGNGSTVKSDVPEKGVVRAGSVWPA